MRCLLTFALLAMVAWPAAAQENEAEKLFRSMEQKLRTAKTVQLRFDSSVTIAPKTGSVKGTLILGEGDKLRLELGGKPFGVEFKLTVVSDGTTMFSKDSTEPKKDKTEKVPKDLGANVRTALPRLGVFVCFNGIDRGNWSPGVLKVSDFKLAGKERVGERNTQVIEYTVTEVKDVISPGKWGMKMWLDAQTHLPVKLTMTMPKDELADISATTDTFSEFTIDAKVDAKLFELPKGPAPKNLEQSLNLSGTKVTDAGLKKKLAGVKSVQILSLIGTEVTDAGLTELAGLKSLRTLGLIDTRMTNAGIAELHKLRPNLNVIR